MRLIKLSKSYKAAIEAQPKSSFGYQALAHFYMTQNNVAEAQNVIRSRSKRATRQPSAASAVGEYL